MTSTMTYTPVFLSRPPIMPLAQSEVALWDDLRFLDHDGSMIVTPGGTRGNGASIPALFGLLWWLLGHPLTAEYVYASLPHDDSCIARTEPHRVVHARFGRALFAEAWRAHFRTPYRSRVHRACGLALRMTRVSLMALAVNVAGPRWEVRRVD